MKTLITMIILVAVMIGLTGCNGDEETTSRVNSVMEDLVNAKTEVEESDSMQQLANLYETTSEQVSEVVTTAKEAIVEPAAVATVPVSTVTPEAAPTVLDSGKYAINNVNNETCVDIAISYSSGTMSVSCNDALKIAEPESDQNWKTYFTTAYWSEKFK